MTVLSMRFIYIFFMGLGIALIYIQPFWGLFYLPMAYVWGRQDNDLLWRRRLTADDADDKELKEKLFATIEHVCEVMETISQSSSTIELMSESDSRQRASKAYLN